jgi:uncharacterized protein (TIGR00369 family)
VDQSPHPRTTSDDEITALLRSRGSPALDTIGGRVLAFDQARREIRMGFEATPAMCHSRVIVQGGFITAMVDSAMAYAAIGACAGRVAVPTLEIKVSFLEAGNPGPMTALARVVRLGRSIGFLEGELFQDGRVIATASSTVRLLFRA